MRPSDSAVRREGLRDVTYAIEWRLHAWAESVLSVGLKRLRKETVYDNSQDQKSNGPVVLGFSGPRKKRALTLLGLCCCYPAV